MYLLIFIDKWYCEIETCKNFHRDLTHFCNNQAPDKDLLKTLSLLFVNNKTWKEKRDQSYLSCLVMLFFDIMFVNRAYALDHQNIVGC